MARSSEVSGLLERLMTHFDESIIGLADVDSLLRFFNFFSMSGFYVVLNRCSPALWKEEQKLKNEKFYEEKNDSSIGEFVIMSTKTGNVS